MRTGARVTVWLIFFWLALAAIVAPAPQAAEPGLAERQAMRQVIERQMQAFQRDDGEGAFAHAAPAIRAMFGTPERFMAMVRSGYAPVYRPREVEFRRSVEFEGKPAQEVFLVGPDGQAVIALYVMERQADGSWLIAGCYLLPAPDRSV